MGKENKISDNRRPILRGALYSDRQVAERLGISVNTLWKWRQLDKARPMARKVGKLTRTFGKDILSFIDECALA